MFISLGFGQTYMDVAASQNVSFNESAPLTYAFGMSFYDFDEDGWDDLTFPTNSDSIVFYRNVNGSFQQIESYIVAIGAVREIVWVDYDNDLDLDICISYHDKGIRLYENDGLYNFSNVTAASGISEYPFQAYGFSFADPDNDGDLDLYVGSHEIQGVFLAPQRNFYYENQGNGNFIEKGQALGIDNGYQPTFMPVWFDYNNDDLLDLAIINDKQLWNDGLYKNLGNGNFSESAVATGFSNDGHNPMTLSIADFNNDGFQDVFKTDVGMDAMTNGVPLDHKLYQNNSGIDFSDIAQGSGLDTNIFSWGALWVDYNNDCFEDLFVATSEGPGYESLLFRNNAGLSFELMNDSISGNISSTSYCPVKGDINNDGFYDVVLLNEMVDPNVLLNSGSANNYIKLDLVGTYSNQKAIGSTIEVYANGYHQTQTVFCGSGMCAQNSQHKIFGLGSALSADSVIVTFPMGIVAKKYNLLANSSYVIKEQIVQAVELNTGVDTVYACDGEQFDIGIQGWFNYAWNTGSQNSILTVDSTGWYSFEASNASGDTLFVCTPIYYDFETELNVVPALVQPLCGETNGGSAELILSPSQLVANVSWSNGVQGTINQSLASGNYFYDILTNNDCTYNGFITIENSPILTSQVITTSVCDTLLGSAEVFVWGGTNPMIYLLGTDTVSNPIISLQAGTYNVVVFDAAGCSDTVTFEIIDNSTASLLSLESITSTIFFHSGYLRVLSANLASLKSIDVFNMMGAKVSSNTQWEFSIDGKSAMLKMDDISSGVYRVVVVYHNALESTSIVVP